MAYSITEKTIATFEGMLSSLWAAHKTAVTEISFDSNNSDNAKKLATNLHQALTAAKKLNHPKYKDLRSAFKLKVRGNRVHCLNLTITEHATKAPDFTTFDTVKSIPQACEIVLSQSPVNGMTYIFPQIKESNAFLLTVLTDLNLSHTIFNGMLYVHEKENQPKEVS